MLADAFASALDLEAVFAMLGLPRYANQAADQTERRLS
jgi:divalent metal cation (Fe/Co/Zn/Cd) transporter